MIDWSGIERRLGKLGWIVGSAVGHGLVALVVTAVGHGIGWLAGHPLLGISHGALAGLAFFAGRELRDLEIEGPNQGGDLDLVVPAFAAIAYLMLGLWRYA